MATHEDWEAAKMRRDQAAYSLSKAYVAGVKIIADAAAAKFAAADLEMVKLERELKERL